MRPSILWILLSGLILIGQPLIVNAIRLSWTTAGSITCPLTNKKYTVTSSYVNGRCKELLGVYTSAKVTCSSDGNGLFQFYSSSDCSEDSLTSQGTVKGDGRTCDIFRMLPSAPTYATTTQGYMEIDCCDDSIGEAKNHTTSQTCNGNPTSTGTIIPSPYPNPSPFQVTGTTSTGYIQTCSSVIGMVIMLGIVIWI